MCRICRNRRPTVTSEQICECPRLRRPCLKPEPHSHGVHFPPVKLRIHVETLGRFYGSSREQAKILQNETRELQVSALD